MKTISVRHIIRPDYSQVSQVEFRGEELTPAIAREAMTRVGGIGSRGLVWDDTKRYRVSAHSVRRIS